MNEAPSDAGKKDSLHGETAAKRQAITELLFFASVGDLYRCRKLITAWGLQVRDVLHSAQVQWWAGQVQCSPQTTHLNPAPEKPCLHSIDSSKTHIAATTTSALLCESGSGLLVFYTCTSIF